MTSGRRLVFLDGDRTLWRTERFMDIVYEQLESRGIGREQIIKMKEQAELSGGSFDAFSALRSSYGETLVDQVVQAVEAEAALRRDVPYDDERCLLTPGARELITAIPAENRVVLTRGGEEMQLAKLRGITGIDAQHDLFEITDREDKGELLAESFDASQGIFVLPWVRNAPSDFTATHVVLVEDKGKALAGLERLGEQATGYWYRDPDEPLLPSQQLPVGVMLPSNVTVVGSLYAARDAILTIQF